ncbi:MAG: glycerophosphodiester phosphodiesterase family protein [Devosia sp.]
MFRKILVGLAIFAGAVYLWNASWLAPQPSGHVQLIAHRGMHQNFNLAGVQNDTCTATRIREPIVSEIENTLPAMQSAFAAGADIVELDVHPTTDGKFAVFHDWTLDCRTEGTGDTRSHDMAYLKTLDIGHGYTADGGKTFPLRGTGVGMMPELSDVLAAMPDKRFIINFKSNEVREGEMLVQFVAAHPEWKSAVWGAYGGDAPTLEAKSKLTDLNVGTRKGLTGCLLQYEAYGWTGILPAACKDTIIMVPLNFAPWLWGWPNRFQQRMADAGTEFILIGPYASGDAGTSGIDTEAEVGQIPDRFGGYVWTNEIGAIARYFRP